VTALRLVHDRTATPGTRVLPSYLDEPRPEVVAFLQAAGFQGAVGETIHASIGEEVVLVVGMGPGTARSLDTLRLATAAAVANARGAAPLLLDLLEDWPHDQMAAAVERIAEAAVLQSYRYARYLSSPSDDPATREIRLLLPPTVDSTCVADAERALRRGQALAEAACLARDLVNTPSTDLGPLELAAEAERVAAGAGLRIRVLDEQDVLTLGMGALAAVGRAGDSPVRLVEVHYEPPGAETTLAFVGKGITFDSGGLSIKTPDQMEWMKNDMAGAAAVLAAMTLLGELDVRCRVIGLLACAENLPGPGAMRPGDIVRVSDGTTVEVVNTDAEGRLVMADAIAHARSLGADAVVDIATLTGSVQVALGAHLGGVMGNSPGLVRQICDAAADSGEEMWPLPLPQRYASMLDSPIADLKNVAAGRFAGALTAGLFLKHFAKDTAWAHLDIDGPALIGAAEPTRPAGGTGFGTTTLARLAASFTPSPSGRCTWTDLMEETYS